MQATIAILPGDGIGAEVTREAVKVLRAVETKFGHRFDLPEALIGGAGLDAENDPFPQQTAAHAPTLQRFCWAQSAGRNGTTYRRNRGPKKACCACVPR